MPDFTTKVLSLNTLFSYGEERRVFRLPRNQRQYSWETKKHAEVLWDDLLRYADSNPNPNNPNYQYYLGNLIYTEKIIDGQQEKIPSTEIDMRDWNVYFLVDGQQRLTTITLLLAAIRDALQIVYTYCGEEDAEADAPVGYEFLVNQLLTIQERQRVATRIQRTNERALRDTISGDEDFITDGITYVGLDTQEQNNRRYKWRMATKVEREAHEEPYPGNVLVNNNHRMFQQKIRDFLESESTSQQEGDGIDINNAVEKLRNMAKLLLNHVQFTTTKVENIGMAYRIFGTINDRGLALSNTDLLRNFILSEINIRVQHNQVQEIEYMEEIEELWNEVWVMERKLQDSFLVNHWSIWRPAIENDEEEIDEEEEVDEEEELDAELLLQIEGLRDWVSKKGLNKKIQTYLLKMDNIEDMMEWIRNLSTSAQVFSGISNPPRPRNNSVESYISDFGSTVHYPFYLALDYHRTLGEENRILEDDQIEDLKIKACKFFMWVRHVFACNTTPVKCLYSKWGAAVINGEDYNSIVGMMENDIPIFIGTRPEISNEVEDVIEKLTNRPYKGKNNQVMRFLYEYNDNIEVAQELQDVLFENLWLEHILPQSVVRSPYHTNNKQWWIANFTIPQIDDENEVDEDDENDLLIPPDALKDFIWNIGNCTILSSQANRSVSNTKFETQEGFQNPQQQPHHQYQDQLVFLSKNHAIRRSQLYLNNNHFIDSIRENPENRNWGQSLETTVWTHKEVEFRSKQIATTLANQWKFW